LDALEGAPVERAVPGDEHVHLDHCLEVDHVERAAPGNSVPDPFLRNVVGLTECAVRAA
jgi:hypothetical protein